MPLKALVFPNECTLKRAITRVNVEREPCKRVAAPNQESGSLFPTNQGY